MKHFEPLQTKHFTEMVAQDLNITLIISNVYNLLLLLLLL